MHKTISLPISPDFRDEQDYVESLLEFSHSHDLFQQLCGGVHILDFLTQEPDLYSTLLPQEWRDSFDDYEVHDILDLLMRHDLSQIIDSKKPAYPPGTTNNPQLLPRRYSSPPESLIQYIQIVRRHTMNREIESPRMPRASRTSTEVDSIARNVAVGMKPKKIHEVGNFVRYIDELICQINSSNQHGISHVVDFGSGQNYLGRALASPPYRMDVVAIESKQHNITGAKSMDIAAQLTQKAKVMRNKKLFRTGIVEDSDASVTGTNGCSNLFIKPVVPNPDIQQSAGEKGHIHYVESEILNGDLSHVISEVTRSTIGDARLSTVRIPSELQLLVISLHSCGNLLHHGLRSITMNPSVKAVAMVGCCYNLMTERLGPPTYKYPFLRYSNLRLEKASTECDPNGFPMSERLATYIHRCGPGVRLNITARMMAVQAPQNWTPEDSESFFTRHYYRALLQRIFMDRGVVGRPSNDGKTSSSPRGWTGAGQPIVLGSMRKSCYLSFTAYVRGAMEKLRRDTVHGDRVAVYMDGLSDEDIAGYDAKFQSKKKELSIVWSLMAFSAGVVESLIVVDRWLYLKEQDTIKDAWVEAIFDHSKSPRNLVVVGIKK